MAFFDNIGKKASETAAKAMQRAQDLSETARLNTMISDQEKRINTAYSQIGKLYVEIHRDDGEEAFSELLEVIRDAEKKINGYRQQLQDMKEGLRCGKCGAVVSKDSAFCSVCGAKIEKKDADGSQCEKCGAPVTSWMRFCTTCGNPLPQFEATGGDNTGNPSVMIPNMDCEAVAESELGTRQSANEMIELEEAGATTTELVATTETGEDITPLHEDSGTDVRAEILGAEASGTPQTAKQICPHCGAEADEGQLFCIECGNSL